MEGAAGDLLIFSRFIFEFKILFLERIEPVTSESQ